MFGGHSTGLVGDTWELVTGGPDTPDFNSMDGVTVQDIFDFLATWQLRLPDADFNGIVGVTVQDIFDFLAAWNAGCP
jgi:hypothetical protein